MELVAESIMDPVVFRNVPSCIFRAWGRGENVTLLEDLASYQLFAKAGNVVNPAVDWRVLALQEQFLRDEAKGDSHSEAGQQEESSILLGTWHQCQTGKCQQEDKGFSGCGS